MPCLVKRVNGTIDKVLLTDGTTESETYKELVEAVDNMPDEMQAYVLSSIKPYVGKYIKNTTDSSEIALGMYLNLHTNKFKDYFGDWEKGEAQGVINNIGEPKVLNTNDMGLVFSTPKVNKSVYNTGEFSQKTSEVYASVKTSKVGTLMTYVDKSIKVLRHRIDDAKKQRDKALNDDKLSFTEKTKRQKYFNALITKSIEQIKVVKEQNNIQYVNLLAETDLDMARAILTNPKTTMSELKIAKKAVEAWKNILDVLGVNSLQDITEEDVRTTVKNIKADAEDLDINLIELSNKLLIEHSISTKAERPLEEKDIDPRKGLKDVSWATATVRDISATGIGLVNYLSKIINEANLNIAKEHNKNNRTIDKEWNLIKDHSEIQKNGFSIFLKEQKNSKLGLNTIGLRGPYAQSYYDAMRVQYKILRAQIETHTALGDKEAIKKAYSDHNDWLKKNTTTFDSTPFVLEDKYTDSQRLVIIDQMKSLGFTSEEVSDMIKKSKELYARYEESAEKFAIGLEYDVDNNIVSITSGITKEQFIAGELKRWKEEHNPLTYIRQQDNYKIGEVRAYKGSYYTLKVPRKEVDGRPSTHYDTEFTKIAADPKLLRFYQFFRDFINEQLGYLPEEEIDDLQSNFLPVITARLAKEYGLSNLKETVNGIGDWFLKHLTSIDIDKRQKTDPITGKVINEFNSRFIDENVDPSERSKDMVVMMKMFSDMALVYKHKLQVQDYVDTVNDIVQNTSKTYTQNSLTGDVKVEPRSPKNLQNMVESSVLNSFYGQKPDEKDITTGRKFFSTMELLTLGLYKSPQYHQAKVLEDKIKDLNTKLDNDKLTDDERVKLDMELTEAKKAYYKLGGRQFSLIKSLDNSVKLTRLGALGFQPFSAFRNLAVGAINNRIHAVGGEDFTRKELNKATNIIKESSKRYLTWGNVNSEGAEKLLRFMLDSGIVDGEDSMFRDGVIDKKSSLEKIKKILPSPFTLMQSTDYLFKAETAVSTALATKVNTSQGVVNFYEVLDKDLNYNEAKYGPWVDADNKNLSFEEFYNKQQTKIGQIAKKLHGFSGDRSSLMGKDNVWGRLLFVFKTWIPETFASRYESKRYDPFLERDVEGYYRTLLRAFHNQGIGAFKTLIRAVFDKDANDIGELERAGLRKVFAEMSTILGLVAMYFGLKALAPDEDDEARKKYMLLVNQVYLLNRDMTYYANINSFGDLTRQVVPIITTYENFLAAGKAMAYYASGAEKEDGTPMYDSERTLLKVSKALPIFNNINRIKYYSTEMSDVR